MTRQQKRTLAEVIRVNIIAAIFTAATFVALFAVLDALNAAELLDRSVVLCIIAAGLVAARLVDAYTAPKRGRSA
jgi:inner membrane protein involved in colicin E2 resistance